MSLPWWHDGVGDDADNADDDTKQTARRLPHSFFRDDKLPFHFGLLFFLFPFAGLVVGFDLFALRSGRNLFSIADACSGEV